MEIIVPVKRYRINGIVDTSLPKHKVKQALEWLGLRELGQKAHYL